MPECGAVPRLGHPTANSGEGLRRRQDAHVPHDEWLRTPRKRKLGRSTSHFSVTSVLFLRADHVLVTAGARPKPCPSPALCNLCHYG